MKFLNIFNETEENLKLALLSLWTPGSHPMRKTMEKLLRHEPLITEPVFQTMFGWEPVINNEWKKYFNAEVLEKLKIGENYPPYKHQADSWKQLNKGKSIVVTSGTGSGKTECFMYPVLNDLYKQKYEKKASNAIQAIFLYPLNALMEDQKSRLSSYCNATGLSFAVYNGDTPEFREPGDLLPNEVGTREDIRDNNGKGTRPQILLTNPSMLEYILVRPKDQKMLQESRKKLRWIVIDEAHSYSGSASVELAYQIKRILEAFDVKPKDIRFVCTSATIGDEEGSQSLIRFISTIIGQEETQIDVIGGKRLVHQLDRNHLMRELNDKNLNIDPSLIMSLRERINEVSGMSIRQLWEWLCPGQEYRIQRALELIDIICEIMIDNKSVLSLRAHYFMRSISGMYACANEKCSGAMHPTYGHITTYKAAVCSNCSKPLLEIVQCKPCRSFVLMGTSDPQTHQINLVEDNINNEDYFTIDENEENNVDNSRPDIFYLLPYIEKTSFNPKSAAQYCTVDIIHSFNQSTLEVNHNNSGKWVELRENAMRSFCPSCGELAYGRKLKFKHFRIPIKFINQTISPVLLRESSKEVNKWGKYIAFTDSRQGTAISAKTFNIDVERRKCREKVISRLFDLESQDNHEGIDINSPELLKLDPIIRKKIIAMLANNIQDSVTLHELSSLIFDEKLFTHIVEYKNNEDSNAYKAALIRNFIGTHRLHDSDAENMGLISLEYPALDNIKVPELLIRVAKENNRNIQDQDWRDFLKIALDYFIRQGNHIQPLILGERKFIRDSTLSTPISANDDHRAGISSWVSVRVNNGGVSTMQNRLVVLLCASLGFDTIEKLHQNSRTINRVLTEAWNDLTRNNILTRVGENDHDGYNNPIYYKNNQYVGCYYLNLSPKDTNRVCLIKRARKVWECPVTGVLLNTVFCGYSPLMSGELSSQLFQRYKCQENQIEMPRKPNDNNAVFDWIYTDQMVAILKERGHWTDRHKYVYESAPAYIAAEHSAQQPKELLRKYTKLFSEENPSINVLHCSTTMEMGVDIGDIDIVLLDTVPPTAANYLQRVGRAGRKSQTKAIAFSLCNNSPVGLHSFANPMWALQTKNHMIPVRSSQIIIQRHINSFFFRQFVCNKGIDIPVTTTIGDFMETLCDEFIQYLDIKSTCPLMVTTFREIFGSDTQFTINITKDSIFNIQSLFNSIIQELRNALNQYQNDRRRSMAISFQIKKVKQINFINYLSEQQFLPNANMPTGVVTFDFIDREKTETLNQLYSDLEDLQERLKSSIEDYEKIIINSSINDTYHRIGNLRKDTQTTREIRIALNEYAPEQTVVVNEKNYISAGVMLFGAYNENTQTKAIYHCNHCGKTEYLPILDEERMCPVCNNPFRSILADGNQIAYTLAYEPVGFRTDQYIGVTREEQTEKHYFEIKPILLNSEWNDYSAINMCQVASSGESGEILYYNVGNGSGFAFCKRCGRAAIERSNFEEAPPLSVRPNHRRLWGDDCNANNQDIARHIVLTGRHQTCYSVLRFLKNNFGDEYEKDQGLIFSLGVILKRALVEYLGIDETEIDFGYKEELNNLALFIFDTARGGCGYSLHFKNVFECEQIFAIARRMLSEYNCNCHIDGGACTFCLIDKNNYKYTNLLSKGKVIEWLNKQALRDTTIPEIISVYSPNATFILKSLKEVVKESIESTEVRTITFFVSDNAGDSSINDWCSARSEMGKMIQKAVEKGKEVYLNIEYHPDLHKSNADRFPFVNIDSRFPDCTVNLIKDMGQIKTAFIISDSAGRIHRYFTDIVDSLPFSNNWGNEMVNLYEDGLEVYFEKETVPALTISPSEIIREGLSPVTSFQVRNYFSKVIAPGLLKSSDIDLMESILKNKSVKIFFSDMFVNSALSSLMLVYLITEMSDLFHLTIDELVLQVNSRRRNCNNLRFSDYSFINFNFPDENTADSYTKDLFERILEITPVFSPNDAEHHRWLRITNSDGEIVEIRPDHSISGGWHSKSTYMNLYSLDGSVIAEKDNCDVLYYVIIKRNN